MNVGDFNSVLNVDRHPLLKIGTCVVEAAVSVKPDGDVLLEFIEPLSRPVTKKTVAKKKTDNHPESQ